MRLRRAAALLLAAALGGCRGSDPELLALVDLDPFANQGSLVAGGGEVPFVAYTAGGLTRNLRIARHDPGNPDRLVRFADLTFAQGPITRLAMGDEVLAAVSGGIVRTVSLSEPLLFGQAPDLVDATDLAVSGRWVLAACGGSLWVERLDLPGQGVQLFPPVTPTAILGLGGRFLAFTETGYVAVDPESGATTLTPVASPALAGVRAAFPAGAGAVVAGSSPSGGARVMRLDLADPAHPAVVRAHELPGVYAAFAWDGGGVSVLAVRGDTGLPNGFRDGYLLREAEGGFSDTPVPLEFWSTSTQPLAAHAGRLFAVEGRGLATLAIR